MITEIKEDVKLIKIDGNETRYSINNFGIIKNTITNYILKPQLNNNGYYRINLFLDNKIRKFYLHRLIALAFIENPLNKKCIDHINNEKLDNRIENLRFVSHSENNINKRIGKNNKSSCKGVYFNKNKQKWISLITFNKKSFYLGEFKNIDDAIKKRKVACLLYFGEFINDCDKS
jgi:hypothetical protein